MIFVKTTFSAKKLSAIRKFYKAERERFKIGSKHQAGYYLVRKDEDGSSEYIDCAIADMTSKQTLQEALSKIGGL